jgi:hypothetical protein
MLSAEVSAKQFAFVEEDIGRSSLMAQQPQQKSCPSSNDRDGED